MAPIRCRRCDKEMAKGTLDAADGRRQAILDQCPVCQAVFVEEFELAVLSEPLAKLPFRVDAKDYPTSEKAGCPACGGWMETVPVSGIDVELCSKCNGVWLEGDEIAALRQRSGGGRARQDPYRASVVTETLGTGMIRCASCETVVEAATTMTLPSGQVCTDCFYRREEKRLGRDEGSVSSELFAGLQKVVSAVVNEIYGAPRWERAADRDDPSGDVARPRRATPGPDARACEACTAARGLIVIRGSNECIHD